MFQDFSANETPPNMRMDPGRKQRLNYTTDSATPLAAGTPGGLDSPTNSNMSRLSSEPWTESQVLDYLESEVSATLVMYYF